MTGGMWFLKYNLICWGFESLCDALSLCIDCINALLILCVCLCNVKKVKYCASLDAIQSR